MVKVAHCAIALGSNLGDSRAILEGAIATLGNIDGIQVQAQSRLYATAAVGPPQPDYLNCSIILTTVLAPEVLLRTLLQIETKFGRVRRERWGPRLLDLDLILFDDLVLETPSLQLPHPRMHERAFVLVPLAEIAPDWIDPVTGKTIAVLAQAVDLSGVSPFVGDSL